ncbi:MAG: hypothetical protein SFU56_21280, partial [Capsulimonadales bacterium]|nr:hypothetical protein [Capsulimonadales bacterium]
MRSSQRNLVRLAVYGSWWIGTVLASTAHAQNPVRQGSVLYYTDEARIDSDISGHHVVIGKRPGGRFGHAHGDTDIRTPYTVTIADGATITFSTEDTGYGSASFYNNSRLAMNGGSAGGVIGFDNSVLEINAGSLSSVHGFQQAEIHFRGGQAHYIESWNSAAVTISGGNVLNVSGLETGSITV